MTTATATPADIAAQGQHKPAAKKRPAKRKPSPNSLFSLLAPEVREQMEAVARRTSHRQSGLSMDQRVANMARTSTALAPYFDEHGNPRDTIEWAFIERSLSAWPEAKAEGERGKPGFVSKALAAARAGMASLFGDYVAQFMADEGQTGDEARDRTVKLISDNQEEINQAELAFYVAIRFGSEQVFGKLDKRRAKRSSQDGRPKDAE